MKQILLTEVGWGRESATAWLLETLGVVGGVLRREGAGQVAANWAESKSGRHRGGKGNKEG